MIAVLVQEQEQEQRRQQIIQRWRLGAYSKRRPQTKPKRHCSG